MFNHSFIYIYQILSIRTELDVLKLSIQQFLRLGDVHHISEYTVHKNKNKHTSYANVITCISHDFTDPPE